MKQIIDKLNKKRGAGRILVKLRGKYYVFPVKKWKNRSKGVDIMPKK